MSIAETTVIYGMDYRSNIDLFDFDKEKDYLYDLAGYHLKLDIKTIDSTVLDISKRLEIDVDEFYRLDFVVKTIFHMCEELDYNIDETNYILDDLTRGYMLPIDPCLAYGESYAECNYDENFIINPVIGMDLYTVISKNKKAMKKCFIEMYESFKHILKDNVTVLDMVSHSKIHSLIKDSDRTDTVHTINEVLN